MTQRSHIISGVWLPGMLLSIPKVAMHTGEDHGRAVCNWGNRKQLLLPSIRAQFKLQVIKQQSTEHHEGNKNKEDRLRTLSTM